jgi:5'-3' exonuclease
MLLDSASLWYRAYFGMPDTLLSPSGEPVNAIRGYLDMTSKLISLYKKKVPEIALARILNKTTSEVRHKILELLKFN